MYPYTTLLVCCLAVPALVPQSSLASSQKDPHADIIWDISGRGLFDSTNQSYPMDGGQVTVDLDVGDAKCPSGLGDVDSGRPDVKEVHLLFRGRQSGDRWLHVLWNPGGSGQEQFAVLYNGTAIGESQLVEAAKHPYEKIASRFKIPLQQGRSDISLVYRSGDGLRFENIVFTRSEDYSAGKELPPTFSPNLKYPTLADYEKAIKEPGVVLDSTYLRFFAPKRKADEASIIFPYLVKAYDELYKIVGVHTRYKIVVYHFPKGTREGFGGTSACTIWYNYDNLEFRLHDEWKQHHVPHVRGYIEEMAHNFVDATHAQFGWEIMGWTIGTQAAQKVAPNPVLTRYVQEARQEENQVFQRYVRAGYVFPRDIEANLCDRIHGWILYQAETQYGPTFWPDFFARIREQQDALIEAAKIGDADQNRNARYRITVDCFDKLGKAHLKDALRQAHISLTTDVKALHPTEPKWDRRFVAAGER